ncbi:PREDICTED: putative F-box/LRR-repeat protein 19 [Camelina sativa]|uniref:F-box/LRR-repeat protein 19 n=1 Tax=Camelina sativa TaxID=90675 RepID=A0ABM0SKM0_CAMSA|nr:PREDICTED: putative F-box/LRR-repeat protein 19 [Camelina sativa]
MQSWEQNSSPDWTELTWECLIDIFSRLSMEQRWNAPMLVCKTWMDVCNDPLLNSIFDLETWFLTSTDSMLMLVVERSKGCLKEIRVRHCTDESLLHVADRCPHLEVLWVKHCPNVTDKSMEKIALKCPKIMELDTSCSYALSSGCLEMFGKNCKNLQIIKQNFTALSEVSRFESFDNYMENLPIIPIGNVDSHGIGCHMQQLKHLEVWNFDS